MRGCFLASNLTRVITIVLPAYAGMFLRPLPKVILPLCSPRVCGDVSKGVAFTPEQAKFSPRMRGCFSREWAARCVVEVLPAYAGMFLGLRPALRISSSSPRVCGDVSLGSSALSAYFGFSPRMRGCFPHAGCKASRHQVLPAYAGMFLAAHPRRTNRYCSPRVCGDVSKTCCINLSTCEFSPRMRGCFFLSKGRKVNLRVLPAYAGMFLHLGTSSPALTRSPRVCGDVSLYLDP